MGQYFSAILIDGNGKATRMDAQGDEPVKIRPQAMMGNPFVERVCRQLIDSPKRVAWIGDESCEEMPADWHSSDGYIPNKAAYVDFYWNVMSKEGPEIEDHPAAPLVDPNIPKPWNPWFLVNRTREEYVNLSAYMMANRFTPDGVLLVGPMRAGCKSDDRMKLCAHPLPFLTNAGGGGSWAFDEIVITQTRPDDTFYLVNPD